MSEPDALRVLGVSSASSRVVFETSLAKSDPRPRYSERTVAAQASCSGQSSEVFLSFYLGQLRQVTCYPRNPDATIAALVERGLIERPKREFTVTRDGIVISGGAAGELWGVTFSSKRLTRAQKHWVARFS